MPTLLHQLLERTLLFAFVVCFAFVYLYTPQQAPRAEAAAIWGATEWTQIGNFLQLIPTNISTYISSSADTTTAGMTSSSFALDNVMDGVAWSLAKSILSEMTSSILNWVNSGFEGSPSFVTDFQSTLMQAADKTFGEYLQQVGGPLSFVCSPFKLDIQVAISIIYENARANADTLAPGACTLTGALQNIEDFYDGTKTFTEAGGWDAWLSITAQPETYTNYGNLLAVRSGAEARLVNAKGEGIQMMAWGDGFLSSKVCETVEDESGGHEKCTITTPGKVINEALTFQTSAGPRSLIEADEINEIVAAVFAQVAQKAVTGAAGLLGLSGGTGHTYSGVPFTEQVGSSGLSSDPSRIRDLISESLANEQNYAALTTLYEPLLIAFVADASQNEERRLEALEEIDKLPGIKADIAVNIVALESLLNDFDALKTPPDPTVLQDISADYFDLDLHTEVEVDGKEVRWKAMTKPRKQ